VPVAADRERSGWRANEPWVVSVQGGSVLPVKVTVDRSRPPAPESEVCGDTASGAGSRGDLVASARTTFTVNGVTTHEERRLVDHELGVMLAAGLVL
jgi:hypothetical protein